MPFKNLRTVYRVRFFTKPFHETSIWHSNCCLRSWKKPYPPKLLVRCFSYKSIDISSHLNFHDTPGKTSQQYQCLQSQQKRYQLASNNNIFQVCKMVMKILLSPFALIPVHRLMLCHTVVLITVPA
jgi:hypothetical protein